MANRLAHETSPYLLQHKDNPVDWWPWGPEAFAEAQRRDVPILLSVGYAACHWCHVMAHESFEDEAVAAVVNARLVAVKVDREERPDVDAVHMEVVQSMTGSGGWPMTVFLTPQGEPFYAGTYFPPRPAHGMPSFVELCGAVAEAWETNRDNVKRQGEDVVRRINRAAPSAVTGARPPTAGDLEQAVAGLAPTFDAVRGGFGGAPKFPPSATLELLLRHGTDAALTMVARTCEAMARGGMYDQLGGGFARYSVDADWVVPHFEKMLYDNAQLARVYLHWWRSSGQQLAERVARETCDWMLADLLTADGGFASALDADSLDEHGHLAEGAFYAWSPDEVGPEVAALCNVTAEGTFEHGRSVLQLLDDPADPDWWAVERLRLLEIRRKRPAPARDDKVVAGWNGLAVAALAECGALLDVPLWISAAERCAELLWSLHMVDGRLRRTSKDGVVGRSAGVLEDYAGVAEGYLTLHQITGSTGWLERAAELLEIVLTRFGDGRGGFYDTADDAESLIARPSDPMDGATPSGASLAAGALLTYAALTGSSRHREAAEAALAVMTPVITSHLRFAGWSAAVAAALVAGPLEVAVVDRPDLLRLARLTPSAGAVVVDSGPLTHDRPGGAAYVCRGFVCELPTSDETRLREQLGISAAR